MDKVFKFIQACKLILMAVALPGWVTFAFHICNSIFVPFMLCFDSNSQSLWILVKKYVELNIRYFKLISDGEILHLVKIQKYVSFIYSFIYLADFFVHFPKLLGLLSFSKRPLICWQLSVVHLCITDQSITTLIQIL